jgi:hypothetical protein
MARKRARLAMDTVREGSPDAGTVALFVLAAPLLVLGIVLLSAEARDQGPGGLTDRIFWFVPAGIVLLFVALAVRNVRALVAARRRRALAGRELDRRAR